ncbi:MAG: cytochrome b/b6 domain-containing protein [Zoogloeaceae bacterium]|jgi:cytochrome b|nr:cytochrome b/b6 domain-containing protein [Zoogloeaceae bacterium]
MACSGEMKNAAEAVKPGHAGRLVVDAPIRMFHALFAVCFFGAWLTSESEAWRSLHVTLGYGMGGLLLFRVVYGLFGPPQARLYLLFGRLMGLPTTLAGVFRAGWASGNANRAPLLGTLQNVSMAATILALIVLAAVAGVSGYLAWNDAPEWVAELHEESGEALINLGVIHIALVLGFSLLRKRNMAATMLTGRIAGPGPSLVRHNRVWLAVVMLVAVLAFTAYDLRQTSVETSAEHDSARIFGEGEEHHADRKERYGHSDNE